MVFDSLTDAALGCGRPVCPDTRMLISCQNCATSYQVDPSSLGATGRSVRCTRCQRVWFAATPTAISEVAQPHRADLAAFPGTAATAESPGLAPQPPGPGIS